MWKFINTPLHTVVLVIKWSLVACTFHVHPPKVSFIFQAYWISIEKARNCSREEITKFSFVSCSNRRPWNKISAAQAVLPLLKPAESPAVALQERLHFYHAWITTGCSRWTSLTNIANYKPSRRRRLRRMKAWRHFSEVVFGLCPSFFLLLRGELCFPSIFS